MYRSRLEDPGHLERTIAENSGGIDGCIDDCIALTSPWGFDPAAATVPVSIWYRRHDVLSPPAHAEWLLSHMPLAEGHVLPRGHSIDDSDVEAIYNWLLSG